MNAAIAIAIMVGFALFVITAAIAANAGPSIDSMTDTDRDNASLDDLIDWMDSTCTNCYADDIEAEWQQVHTWAAEQLSILAGNVPGDLYRFDSEPER